MNVKTSFVIPHKGREEMLIQTLDSIAAQDFPASEYEIIVVSQNHAVSEALSVLASKLPLSIIYNDKENTISHSRNLGAEVAEGKYLAFLDADVALAPDWLKTMMHILNSSPSIALVSAMQMNSVNAPPLERIRTALSNADLDTNVSFLPGRNLFLRKETFIEAGKFPEHLQTCEDYYFTDKVNQLGNLYYTSKTQYVHIGEDKAFIPMWKKEIWRGQSNIASLKGRRIPMREWPSFIIPFAVSGGFFLAFIGLLISQPWFTTVMLIGAILPVILYTIRLKTLTKESVQFYHCAFFYLLYFPARAIGTILGVRGVVDTSSHKK